MLAKRRWMTVAVVLVAIASLRVQAGTLYQKSRSTIMAVNLESGSKNAIFICDSDITAMTGNHKFLYYADGDNKKLIRQEYATNTTIELGRIEVAAMHLDWTTGNLYAIVNNAMDTMRVMVCSSDLARCMFLYAPFRNDKHQPTDIVLNAANAQRLVYWINTERNQIMSGAMDGSSPSKVFVQSPIGFFGGLTLDVATQRLYWTLILTKNGRTLVGSVHLHDGAASTMMALPKIGHHLKVYKQHLFIQSPSLADTFVFDKDTLVQNRKTFASTAALGFGALFIDDPTLRPSVPFACSPDCDTLCLSNTNPATKCVASDQLWNFRFTHEHGDTAIVLSNSCLQCDLILRTLHAVNEMLYVVK